MAASPFRVHPHCWNLRQAGSNATRARCTEPLTLASVAWTCGCPVHLVVRGGEERVEGRPAFSERQSPMLPRIWMSPKDSFSGGDAVESSAVFLDHCLCSLVRSFIRAAGSSRRRTTCLTR